MEIEEKGENYVVRFSKKSFTKKEVEDYLRYFRFRKLMAGTNPVTDEQIYNLAEEVNEEYLSKISGRFPFLK